MSPLDVQLDKPSIDGRYVCFIRCAPAQAKAWVEPVIMVWHSDRWKSTFMPQANVFGWIGPIPPMKAIDLMGSVAVRAQEFDL